MITYPLSIGGTLTRAIEHGQGGDLVIFIHGVGARADRWRANVAGLGNPELRCVALDLPGHGFAYKGSGFNYSVGGFADLILNFIKQQSATRVRLVGTSLGGHIAGAIACREPGLISGLMLVGATGLFPIGGEARANISRRIMDRSREGITRKLNHVVIDANQVTPDLIEEEFQINNSAGATESFASLARYFAESLDDDVVGPALAAIQGRFPISIIWGELDRSVPLEIGQRAAALLDKARFDVIPGAGHAPYFERANEFNQLASKFLAG